MTLRRLILISAYLLLPFHASASSSRDNWQSLLSLRHNVGFVFVERDSTCIYGTIKSVSNSILTVKAKQADIAIDKATLIRVRLGFDGHPLASNQPNMPLFTLYSGRSSWADVLAFEPFKSKDYPSSRVHFVVTSRNGKSKAGTLDSVTADDIAIEDSFRKQSVFRKSDIARVDYVVEKPLSDTQEFYWEELAMFQIFDPVLYPRMFHLGDTMRVRLYDSNLTENDDPVICR